MNSSLARHIIWISGHDKNVAVPFARREETIRNLNSVDAKDVLRNDADIVGPLEVVVEFVSDCLRELLLHDDVADVRNDRDLSR